MRMIRQLLRRTSLMAVAFAVFASWLMVDMLILIQHVKAAPITNRKVHISNSAVGTRTAGQNVTYTFTFTVPGAASTVQSMDFQFCTAPLPGTDCNLPTGQSVTGAAIVGGSQSGLTGWSLGTAGNAPTNTWSNGTSGTGGRIRITRTDATNVSSNTAMSIAFNGITNPSTADQEFFIRLVTYTDTAWTTSRDTGSVANSTATQIDITAKVQEVLNFSVGVDGNADGSVDAPTAACNALTEGGTLSLGDTDGVLSFTQAYDDHSYFRVSTNANNGTVIYYAGDTLKYSTFDINEIGSTATASAPGTEQFGLGINSADTTTNGYSFTQLTATAPYNAGNGTITSGGTATFAFEAASLTTPRQIASAAAPIVCDTGSVRYIGNIATTTPPGLYTTSISYIATPTY
ncbi:MAG TPA: hypothetical protein VFM05_12030 [Candidatus Saccharimonadales bacterium]|nr:hypothetical protein [Candidatus Saccharimonadales bacterium]